MNSHGTLESQQIEGHVDFLPQMKQTRLPGRYLGDGTNTSIGGAQLTPSNSRLPRERPNFSKTNESGFMTK